MWFAPTGELDQFKSIRARALAVLFSVCPAIRSRT
jgi:hypothetical protein